MDEYQKQVDDFLSSTNTTMSIKFKEYGIHFDGDKDKRDIYAITLKRGDREFSFDFGQSLKYSGLQVVNRNNGITGFVISTNDYMNITKNETDVKMLKWKINHRKLTTPICYRIESCDKLVKPVKPNSYVILACLQKYDVGTLDDFCNDFGYDVDSISANKTYKAVCEEFKNVQTIWTDEEIEELSEIQ